MPTTVPTREVYWNIQGIWIMYVLVAVATAVFCYGAYRYYRLLSVGKPADRFDRPGQRVKELLAHAFAQGRTIQRRYSGLSHLAFSWGFVVLFIGTVVVMIHEDLGSFFPVFRIMQGNFYLVFQSLTLDVLGLGAVIGLALTMLRRFGGPEARHDRLYRAPSDPRSLLDDWLILGGFEVILVTGFVIEGARIVATADPWGAWSPVGYVIGLALAPLGVGALLGLHLGLWWFHLLLALAWLAYLPYSKLRHIAAAPANIYLQSHEPKGALSFIDIEKAFEQDPPPIGLSKLDDLTWKDRLDVQACTECTRCELACPAARTGKALSPMLLILDLRNQLLKGAGAPPLARTRIARGDEADAAGNVTATGKVDMAALAPGALPLDTAVVTADGDGANGTAALPAASGAATADAPAPLQLVGDVITDAVLWDCTTCRACMEACPVFIEHVPKIVDMRRHLVLVESRFEPELQRLFDNLEAAGNPWRFPRSDRANWAKSLETPVPILGQDVTVDEIDVLYWVGCAGSYDERNQKVARALAGLLQTAGVRFAILGTQETCTGDPARRAGNEYLFQILAGENVATLTGLGLGADEEPGDRRQETGEPKTILASCPHCFNTLKDEYPQLGGRFVVRHHAEYLADLVRSGKLQPSVPLESNGTVAYHDPCYLGRYQDIFDQPREVLDAIPGLERKEVRAGCRRGAMCCGAGGAKIWFEERRGTRVNHLRMEHIQAENPDRVAVACPFCMIMLEDGARAKGVFETLPILDISEFLTNSLAARSNGGTSSSPQAPPPPA
ncbi:MAG: (Fe-S)-binding protein [Chloroflexota bacterium]